MTRMSIGFHLLRLRFCGLLAWWWLGMRTRFAARREAATPQSFLTVDPEGVVQQRPAAYQRLLSVRLERYLEIMTLAATKIHRRGHTTYEHRIRRLGQVERRLAKARESVPEAQEPPGLLSTVGPMALAALVAMPLTWPFAESLGQDYLSTILLVIGVVILEVCAGERAGGALASLIYNEPDSPVALSDKEVLAARLRLGVFGGADHMLMGSLAVGRAAQGQLVMWLALGAISAALGVFAGVALERARPWRRLRRFEHRSGRATRARDEAGDAYDLATRRIAAVGIGLIRRTSELDEHAAVVFTRRWRRRHEGIVPEPPPLRLPDEQAVIAQVLELLRNVDSVVHRGVDLRLGVVSA